MDRVAIIIVNWNTTSYLEDCLKSIKKNVLKVKYKVYVVDNASSDLDVLKFKKKFPWVILEQNKINLGFGIANNQIAKKVNEKYFFILNPDTIIYKNSIETLLQVLKSDPDIAACGPKMLDKDGKLQREGFYRRAPSLIQALLFYTDLVRVSLKNKFLVSHFWESDTTRDEIIEVDQIPGAALLIKREDLKKVGFFDEDYPFWFEDVDLSYKLRKKNKKLMYAPVS